MAEHTKHLTISNALAADCLYGECEHLNEDGEPSDYSACPSISIEVCIDCMVERGQGNDPTYWEEELISWPHEVRAVEPEKVAIPKLLKAPPENIRCGHGYDHHSGPHSCDSCDRQECAYWAWVKDHERAVARIVKDFSRDS